MFLVGISCVSAENMEEISTLSTSGIADDVISVDDATDGGEYVSMSDADDDVISSDNSLNDALQSDESNLLSYSGSVDVYNWTAFGDEVSNDTGVNIVNIKANLTPENQIIINRSLTIIGSADTYIGGSSSSDIVNYNDLLLLTEKEGISVTLKNIKFQNCRGNTLMKFAGNGNYVLENCTFENITAPGYRQVIVHLNWGNLNITNCTFEKCTTSFGTVSNFKSDAEPNAVHMIVRDTTFKSNHASAEPGAINNCGQLEVYDSIFESNDAAWWAGAIHTHSNANTTIVRSIFRDNLANWNGGALSTYSYLKVVNSTFIHNIAKTDAGGAAIYGFNQGGNPYIIVENCDFTNNNASSGNGGAITVVSGTLIVNDSRFDNNTAENNNGGAISSGISTTTINNCNFTNNRAKNMGGAIFAANIGSLEVYHSIFDSNYAAEGEAINYYYSGTKENSSFLTFCHNIFTNTNGTNLVYAYPKVNVTAYNNTYDEYVVPDQNQTGDVIPIPEDTDLGKVKAHLTFEGVDTLTGNIVMMNNCLLVPANHTLYCYDISSGSYIPAWTVTSGAGCFGGLYVRNGIIYAPCAGDQLYILDLATGNSLTSAPILEGSSLYEPFVDGNTLYLSSENGYGPNNNSWISIVNAGSFNYTGSILELNGVPQYNQAMLSKPVIKGNYLYVNTIYGLIRYDLTNGNMINITDTVGNFVINNDGTIWVLRNVSGSTSLSLLDSNLTVIASSSLNGNCSELVTDGNGKVYTVDTNGYIHSASYSAGSINLYRTAFHINPVSSAMTYSNGYLYIGDDEGILWVFNVNDLKKSELEDAVNWCFNASYPIVGKITVDTSGRVYICNINGDFFVVSKN